MADRTAADVFAKILELLAQNPSEENKKVASVLYQLIEEFDFSPKQMYIPNVLEKLNIEMH